jgi:hypothetical protein
VTEILTERVSAPNVWTGDELADAGRWIIRFTEEDFADFERALAHVSKRHLKDATEIRAEDFPLPHFQERIDDIVNRTPVRHSSTTPMTQRVNGTCCDCGSADPKPADRSAPSTRSGAAATRPARSDQQEA